MAGAKEYVGGAAATTVAGAVGAADVSIVIASSVGWPTGPTTKDFVAVIDRGTASEEKIRFSARAGTTLTVAARGYDGSSAVAHANGAPIEHVLDADSIQDFNDHVYNTGLDAHSQYLNTARHDVAARHTFGAAFATPAAPPDIATAAGAGAAGGPARSDHTHKIGPAAINAPSMFAADVVDQAAVAPGSVGTPELINDAVTFAKFQNIQTDRLVGRDTAATGDVEEIIVGPGLEFGVAQTLQRSAFAGGDVTAGAGSSILAIGAGKVTQAMLVPPMRAFYICTSSTRPGSPIEGDRIYETDTDSVLIWTGTAWRKPWNMPWGIIDHKKVIVGQSGINTNTALTGLTSTTTYVANRHLRITGYLPQASSADIPVWWALAIWRDGAQIQVAMQHVPVANSPVIVFSSIVEVSTAGAHTYALYGLTGAAGYFNADAATSTYLLIEDIGPAGAAL